MLRLIGKLLMIVFLLTAGTLAVIRAQPHADYALRGFLDSTCASCFMDVQAGVSKMNSVMVIMRSHPWVGMIRYARGMALDSGLMSWTWSGAQPTFIDPAVDGKLWIQDGRVLWLEVATRFTFGDLWLLRSPLGGRTTLESVEPRRAHLEVDYDRLLARAEIVCPLLPQPFWNAPVVFRLMSNNPPAETSDGALPCWQCCA